MESIKQQKINLQGEVNINPNIVSGTSVSATNKRYAYAMKKLYDELKEKPKPLHSTNFVKKYHVDNLVITVLMREGILLKVGKVGHRHIFKWDGREPNLIFADLLRRKVHEYKMTAPSRAKKKRMFVRSDSSVPKGATLKDVIGEVNSVEVAHKKDKGATIESVGTNLIKQKESVKFKKMPKPKIEEKAIFVNEKRVEVNLFWGLFRYKKIG